MITLTSSPLTSFHKSLTINIDHALQSKFMSIKTYPLAVIAFMALLLLFTKPAHALNSPQKISTSTNDNLAPAIVADSNGKIHVVWMDAPNGWSSSTTTLVHSFWNGAVWSTPTTIASGNFHELPALAADSNGNIHLAWDADTNPSAWQIYYSKYNGTSWSAAVAISGSTAGDTAWDSDIAIDSSGNPHVAYTFIPAGTVGNQRFTYYAKFNGASWVAPINLTESGTFHQYPTIAADKVGKVQVAWKSTASDNSSYQIVHREWNGSTFSSTNSVSGVVIQINEAEPRIITDNNNLAHLVWEERVDPLSADFNIKYSKRNGTWSAPFTVSALGSESAQGVPSVAILRSSVDDVLIGWIDKSVSPFKVGFRKFIAATSSWDIARSNNINQTSADFPVATMDKWDNVHVAWGELNSSSKYDINYDAIPLAAKEIGAAGGTLTTFNGDTLTIPAGALSSNTIISAQITPLSQAAPSGSNTPNRQYVFEPSGTTFATPAQTVFTYTDAEFSGAGEKNIGIYVWDSTTNSWVFKTGTLNKGANTVTFNLDHFSIYSFFSVPDVIDWTKPLTEDTDSEFTIGRTIPIKFSFNQNSYNPNEVSVQVVNKNGAVVAEFESNHGKNTLRYEEDSGLFITNLETKDLSAGLYQVNILENEEFKGSVQFILN